MKKEIKDLIEGAILALQKEKVFPDFEIPEIELMATKDEKFGDYTTNIAMVLARLASTSSLCESRRGKVIKKKPIEIAEEIITKLKMCHSERSDSEVEESNSRNKLDPSTHSAAEFTQDDKLWFSKVEAADPGYINFYLSEKYLQEKVLEINKSEKDFGNNEIGKRIKLNNEFISANPTGPLHLGNGRGGFYGDTLSNILKKSGYNVTNEYYVNNAGEQVIKLGHSVLKDSEAVYSGDYIDKLNSRFSNIKEVSEVGKKAADYILENIIKKTIENRMKVKFDSWFQESELHNNNYIEKALDKLKEKKLTYEKEDVLWLKTTDFGDDKDRVLIKKDGNKTYLASDCGYILNKKERGFDKIIEIWGADHYGYISRFRAVAEALGFAKENVKFIIIQLVRLVKDGKEVKMSKRAGNVVYIDELIDKVGYDVARFFFLMYSPDTHMNFDLSLAKERSEKNPVYYVQYAHARIHSILAKVKSEKLQCLPAGRKVKSLGNLSLLNHDKELSLIKELNKFPELIEEIAENYEIHKLSHYAIGLADKFHSFYGQCQVIDEENPELSSARLELAKAVKIVLAETLRLIGVSALESM
jgi:arginyl-tRNA synthetase